MSEQELLKEFEILDSGSRVITNQFHSLQKEHGDEFVIIKMNKVLKSAHSFEEITRFIEINKIKENEIIVQFIPAKGELILY